MGRKHESWSVKVWNIWSFPENERQEQLNNNSIDPDFANHIKVNEKALQNSIFYQFEWVYFAGLNKIKRVHCLKQKFCYNLEYCKMIT